MCVSRVPSPSLSLTLRERQSAVRCVFHRAKIFKFSKFCGGSLNIYLVWHWAASTCYVKHFVCFGLFFCILQSPLIASAVISWGKEPAQKPSNCKTLWVFHANLKVSARCQLTHRFLSFSPFLRRNRIETCSSSSWCYTELDSVVLYMGILKKLSQKLC